MITVREVIFDNALRLIFDDMTYNGYTTFKSQRIYQIRSNNGLILEYQLVDVSWDYARNIESEILICSSDSLEKCMSLIKQPNDLKTNYSAIDSEISAEICSNAL